MKQPIYLDYNATTPVHPEVFAKMLPYFTENYGNAASSTHGYGWRAKDAVEESSTAIGNFIGCLSQELIFTSGATESINMAIKGVFFKYRRKGKHIVVLSTEHKATLDTCDYLAKYFDAEISKISVDHDGIIDIEQLKNSIREDTLLVCCMLVNNETGVIQPIAEIASIVHEKNSILMCDATQAVGKMPVNVDELGVDLMAFSAHKFYGPKGVGGLFIRRKKPRVVLDSLIHGGGHQRNLRSGTLNVPGIVGLAAACKLAMQQMEADEQKIRGMRDQLEELMLTKLPKAKINGHIRNRIYNTSNISFTGHIATDIIRHSKTLMAISTGSACSSIDQEPSHVLMEMFDSKERALSSIRFSLGKFVLEKEMVNAVSKLIGRLTESA